MAFSHNNDDSLYEDVLNVSVYKPLAYMEIGEFRGQPIRPRCIAYVPRRILNKLLENDGVYVITNLSERNGDELQECKDVPNNNRLILVKDDDKVRGTHVFHLSALQEMLILNEKIVLEVLNRGHSKQNNVESYQMINESAVIDFVKSVSRETNWNDKEQALIDACFADPTLLRKGEGKEISLTPQLTELYKKYEEEFSKDQSTKYESHFKIIEKLILQLSDVRPRSR